MWSEYIRICSSEIEYYSTIFVINQKTFLDRGIITELTRSMLKIKSIFQLIFWFRTWLMQDTVAYIRRRRPRLPPSLPLFWSIYTLNNSTDKTTHKTTHKKTLTTCILCVESDPRKTVGQLFLCNCLFQSISIYVTPRKYAFIYIYVLNE